MAIDPSSIRYFAKYRFAPGAAAHAAVAAITHGDACSPEHTDNGLFAVVISGSVPGRPGKGFFGGTIGTASSGALCARSDCKV